MIATGDSETWLFDLDGTLIDSIELIGSSFEHVSEQLGLGWPRGYWRPYLGQTLAASFEILLGSTDRVDELVECYRTHNLARHDALVRPYPGILETVRELGDRPSVRLGVVTSKKTDVALRGLEICGLGGVFELVIGSCDVARHKPDPLPVTTALERLGSRPDRSYYVGDSPHDIAAGNAAGVATVAVGWGPFEAEVLARHEPHHWVNEPRELLTVRPR